MKEFRLFKRDDSGKEISAGATGYKDRSYYFRFVYRGKAYVRCLETNLVDDAQRRAKARFAEIASAVQSKEYKRVDATKLRQDGSATLEEIYAAYRTGPSEAQNREANVHALKAVTAGAANIRELTPALVRQWFQAVSTKAAEETDQQRSASLKRSANSRWAQAASLFTPKCIQHYKDLDLVKDTAAIDAFLKAGKAARFDKKKLKIIYRPPAETIIQKTLEAWLKIENRDLFLVIGHELAFGLRKGEMMQARWSWHTTRNGYPALDGNATVKNGSGLVQVRALDPWYHQMMQRVHEMKWQPEGDDLIISAGTMTYRTEDIYNAVSAWLRDLGWQTQKTNHALRAYAGSQIAMKYGIWEASSWLRHSSVEVTQSHYTYFISTFPVANKDLIAAHWPAVAETTKVTSKKIDVTLDVTPDLRQTPPDSAKVLPWMAPARN